ncbi:uncharacterized protein [Cherax quadricarinatus]
MSGGRRKSRKPQKWEDYVADEEQLATIEKELVKEEKARMKCASNDGDSSEKSPDGGQDEEDDDDNDTTDEEGHLQIVIQKDESEEFQTDKELIKEEISEDELSVGVQDKKEKQWSTTQEKNNGEMIGDCTICGIQLRDWPSTHSHLRFHRLSYVPQCNYGNVLTPLTKRLNCQVCQRICQNREVLAYHAYTEHYINRKDAKCCPFCSKNFKDNEEFQEHLDMDIISFKCQVSSLPMIDKLRVLPPDQQRCKFEQDGYSSKDMPHSKRAQGDGWRGPDGPGKDGPAAADMLQSSRGHSSSRRLRGSMRVAAAQTCQQQRGQQQQKPGGREAETAPRAKKGAPARLLSTAPRVSGGALSTKVAMFSDISSVFKTVENGPTQTCLPTHMTRHSFPESSTLTKHPMCRDFEGFEADPDDPVPVVESVVFGSPWVIEKNTLIVHLYSYHNSSPNAEEIKPKEDTMQRSCELCGRSGFLNDELLIRHCILRCSQRNNLQLSFAVLVSSFAKNQNTSFSETLHSSAMQTYLKLGVEAWGSAPCVKQYLEKLQSSYDLLDHSPGNRRDLTEFTDVQLLTYLDHFEAVNREQDRELEFLLNFRSKADLEIEASDKEEPGADDLDPLTFSPCTSSKLLTPRNSMANNSQIDLIQEGSEGGPVDICLVTSTTNTQVTITPAGCLQHDIRPPKDLINMQRCRTMSGDERIRHQSEDLQRLEVEAQLLREAEPFTFRANSQWQLLKV